MCTHHVLSAVPNEFVILNEVKDRRHQNEFVILNEVKDLSDHDPLSFRTFIFVIPNRATAR
jgi:hypothetical protein